ncbi:Calcium-binding protein KIC [Dichanthelium oligosanthes]|uniref:Calcium-binding protein KIC n=1 Tax=Dichanthelium oligosanthes TaxID=888268 RepID=A0A1E5V947_9POAL|nr:Calcium-binding protein KIC [Dichanthelium oligosanthes]
MAASSSASPRTGGAGNGNGANDGSSEAAAYEDLLPVMGERLGTAGLLSELQAGFRLLADPAQGAITAESLRRGAAAALGVVGMTAEEAAAMVREGDSDGDGALSEAEFCVLMVRLSPGIMADAEAWLEEAIEDELAAQDDEGLHHLADGGGAASAPAASRRSSV